MSLGCGSGSCSTNGFVTVRHECTAKVKLANLKLMFLCYKLSRHGEICKRVPSGQAG